MSDNQLEATDYLEAGDYEYSGTVIASILRATLHDQLRDDPCISGYDQPPDAPLSGKKTHSLGKPVSVNVKCNEPCTATGTGTLNVPNASQVYRLKKVTGEVEAGEKPR